MCKKNGKKSQNVPGKIQFLPVVFFAKWGRRADKRPLRRGYAEKSRIKRQQRSFDADFRIIFVCRRSACGERARRSAVRPALILRGGSRARSILRRGCSAVLVRAAPAVVKTAGKWSRWPDRICERAGTGRTWPTAAEIYRQAHQVAVRVLEFLRPTSPILPACATSDRRAVR